MSYAKVIGVGGIGTGLLFLLEGDHTIGREESRAGRLSDARDHCKGHIIAHYIAALSGCRTELIGMVGNDARGSALLDEMRDAGIGVAHVGVAEDMPTMLSVCFQYPDRSGGNVTASNSASMLVDEAYVCACLDGSAIDEDTIVFAAPEVPLKARFVLMRRGRQAGALVAGTFLSNEAGEFLRRGGAGLTDVLAVNRDEARAAANAAASAGADVACACWEAVRGQNPRLKLAVTAGGEGAYLFEGNAVRHIPAMKSPARNTAGAGDAFLAGLISGLARGMCFFDAGALGSAAAGLSVQSQDTIARSVGLAGVLDYMERHGCGEGIADRLRGAARDAGDG